MKKFVIFVILCASLIFSASCGETTDGDSSNQAVNANETPEKYGEPKEDIFGSVSGIVGNLATIKLAVMPEAFPVPRRIDTSGDDAENRAADRTGNGTAPAPAVSEADMAARMAMREEAISAAGNNDNIAPVLLDYTDDEIEFIIPVGIPIYAVTDGENDSLIETEVEMSEIKTGNVINVIYKSDGKTIDKILLSQVVAVSIPQNNNENDGGE